MANPPKWPKVPTPPGRRECTKCAGRGHRGPQVNARDKGQRGEREIVKLLQAVVDTVRGSRGFEPIILQRNALQAHLGGCDLHGLEGFAVEVKFCEELKLKDWWAQALRQAAALGAVPVLMYRSAGQDWTVKWRASVQVPGEREGRMEVELDIETDMNQFLFWFEDAYAETLVGVKATEQPPPPTERLDIEGILKVDPEWNRPLQATTPPPPCTCVEFPSRHCAHCHS